MVVTIGKLMTKVWRFSQDWYVNGKQNECEKWQIQQLETQGIVFYKKGKTGQRINKKTNKISECKGTDPSFFTDWTEDFDCIENIDDKTIYYNLKMVVSEGGAQNRTIKCICDFIQAQSCYHKKNNHKNIYFVNILDGDKCDKHMVNFNYSNSDPHPNIYIGDLAGYMQWYDSKVYPDILQ